MTEDPLRYPTVLFDWGDTVLRDDPGMTAAMVEWETVEAIEGIADVLCCQAVTPTQWTTMT